MFYEHIGPTMDIMRYLAEDFLSYSHPFKPYFRLPQPFVNQGNQAEPWASEETLKGLGLLNPYCSEKHSLDI